MEDVLKLEYHMPRLYFMLRRIRRLHRLKKYKKMTLKSIAEIDSHLFKIRIGRDLDWTNIRSYNEKLQYEKLFNVNPIKTKLADKYLVREWVSTKIGSDFLIPLIGVWCSVDSINFDMLPNSFVLKTNCSSGDAIIVKDKTRLTNKDITRIKAKLNFYLMYDWGYETFERHYSDIDPVIIAEQLLPTDDTDVPDYKFTCFDGEPYCCRVDIGRYHDHRRNTYDLNWKLQPWNAGRYPNTDYDFPKPKNFELMVELARKLSEGFPQVRVDFYNIDGKIYFGEMTFTSGSGLEPIVPESIDYELGKLWKQDCIVPEEYL